MKLVSSTDNMAPSWFSWAARSCWQMSRIAGSSSGAHVKNCCMGWTDCSSNKCKAMGSIDLRSKGLSNPLTKAAKWLLCFLEKKAQSYWCRYVSKSLPISCVLLGSIAHCSNNRGSYVVFVIIISTHFYYISYRGQPESVKFIL